MKAAFSCFSNLLDLWEFLISNIQNILFKMLNAFRSYQSNTSANLMMS